MKVFLICHTFITVALYALSVFRRTDVYNDDVVYLPKAYYIICSLCAVVFIFPIVPCLFEEYWTDVYYVLIPIAIATNLVRLFQLNWRIVILDNGIVYRNMFGIVRSFSIDTDTKIQKVLGIGHLLQLEDSRIFIVNDVMNVERLVERINIKS